MSRTLVIAIGNPSRGDDALGPLVAEALEGDEVEVLVDFQLQPEHALDVAQAERVLFIDAAMSLPTCCSLDRVTAQPDPSITTHRMSPAAVLHVCERVLGRTPPEAWVLAVRGVSFELGANLSPDAQLALGQARALASRFVKNDSGLRACSTSRTSLSTPR